MSTAAGWTNRVGVAARARGIVRDLPVDVERISTRQLELPGSWPRVTTLVQLHGGGEVGTGEDIAYSGVTQDALTAAFAPLDVAGSWTIGSLSSHLDAQQVGAPKDPHMDDKPGFHRWAVESAALDLALRQAGINLATLLDESWRPVQVSLSMGLGDPASTELLERWLERDPTITFKLDTSPQWSDEIVQRLAALGTAVSTVDFKGLYRGDWKVQDPVDPELYARVARELPAALLEDADLTHEVRAALDADALGRLTWDYPILAPSDVPGVEGRVTGFAHELPAAINIKPSRFGTIDSLLATIELCDANGIPCYAGGQFELGVGRTHVQSIASLCFPDGPNDCAPALFHTAQPDSADAPLGPVTPPAGHVGFGWDAPTPAVARA
jgi:L-alanine-DL-glutamate epimerase-like enolase superfamily enzyme